jgi:hypothetical protein
LREKREREKALEQILETPRLDSPFSPLFSPSFSILNSQLCNVTFEHMFQISVLISSLSALKYNPPDSRPDPISSNININHHPPPSQQHHNSEAQHQTAFIPYITYYSSTNNSLFSLSLLTYSYGWGPNEHLIRVQGRLA